MLEKKIRHLPVTDGSKLVGIVTDRDIRLNLPSAPSRIASRTRSESTMAGTRR
jgi:CBS domain-containing protein